MGYIPIPITHHLDLDCVLSVHRMMQNQELSAVPMLNIGILFYCTLLVFFILIME
jgi:hypothetical protein